MSFLVELKRRKTVQVAAIYVVASWLLVQIVATAKAPLSLPDWVGTLVIVLLIIGFPIALFLRWAFKLTHDSIVREDGSPISAPTEGRGVEYVLVVLIVVALAWIGYRAFGGEGDNATATLESSVAALTSDNVNVSA